ncbi:hypothetical protein T492DRAFT_1054257 [Pavlovales sp. CCMP2436]|nr:hypothetical protein T492DRAFT_1054257 [Pavlovales sp. CCMP2436]
MATCARAAARSTAASIRRATSSAAVSSAPSESASVCARESAARSLAESTSLSIKPGFAPSSPPSSRAPGASVPCPSECRAASVLPKAQVSFSAFSVDARLVASCDRKSRSSRALVTRVSAVVLPPARGGATAAQPGCAARSCERALRRVCQRAWRAAPKRPATRSGSAVAAVRAVAVAAAATSPLPPLPSRPPARPLHPSRAAQW